MGTKKDCVAFLFDIVMFRFLNTCSSGFRSVCDNMYDLHFSYYQ